MNKLTKAGIATGAAVALLMGGAGTLAYWNSEADLATGSVTAGNLAVTAVTGPNDGWEDESGAAISSIAAYRIVPGDTLTYTKRINVVAVGDTLEAELSLSDDAITPAGAASADSALAALLTANASFTVVGALPAGVTDNLDGTLTFEPGTSPLNVSFDVEVEIEFPNGLASVDNPAKNGQVSLADFAVVLEQQL